MNILVLNWRDIKNPLAGGAEKLTHEMVKRWVKMGHFVTCFSAGFKNCKSEEVVDGVRIVRRGTWWTVHLLAFFYYFVLLRRKTDVIIDEVHWFPFFSAVYARKKTILLTCEVADELFLKVLPYPLARLGIALERFYLWLYKDFSVLAISSSTKASLIKSGFKKNLITVLPMGLTVPTQLILYPKEKNPTIIYLGRLNVQKGIEDAIEAFSIVKRKFPSSVFWVVGSGKPEYVSKLKEKVKNEGFNSSAIFFGFVSDQEKFSLLSRAHVLVASSVHEGWGLIVPEAGLVGTPAVGYDIYGIRDVIKDKKTGYLSLNKNPLGIAECIIRALKNKSNYIKLSRAAKKLSLTYNWDNTAKIALKALNNKQVTNSK